MQVPDLRKRQKGGEEGADGAKASATAGGGGGRRMLLVAGLGVLVLGGLGLVGAAAIGVSMTSGGGEVKPLEPSDPPLVHIEAADTDPVTPGDAIEPEDDYVFKPVIPEPPRRLPHRPGEYTQPPPGGRAQYEAVQMARNRQCADSLDAVRAGMKASIDHATLYSQSWFCFNEVHQRPLMEAQAESWEDFRRLAEHFEGPADMREEQSEETKRLPPWFRPAADGIEYRLEAWE